MLFRQEAPYSQDLRSRVFALADAGTSVGLIAKLLLVSASYVSKVLTQRQRTGERSTQAQRCHMRPNVADSYEAITAEVKACPDITLGELRPWLLAKHQVSAS